MNRIGFIMGSKYFKASTNPYRKTAMLLNQKKMIERHYRFLKCTVSREVLTCWGQLENSDLEQKYLIEIRCEYGKEPVVKILEPSDIVPSIGIHMYDDRSLCLFYPPDLKWTAHTPIYKFTIPWLIEWPYNYELYCLNGGIWEGRQSPSHD